MISNELKNIFSQAVNYAKTRRHEYLTSEHVFLMLIHDEEIENLFAELGVSTDKLFDDIRKYVDENTPVLPVDIEDEPVETISLTGTIEYMITHTQTSGKMNANVEDMFVALLKDEKAYSTYVLKKLGIQRIDILEEMSHKEQDDEFDENTEDKSKENKILDNNSTDLVELAKKGEIDPVIGRDMEISRAVEILSRRKKNNPILVGEPGVGKTAIAEGLALQIVNKEVPEFLHDAKIYSLDMGSMLAGTKYRGDFEKKFKGLLKEVEKIPGAILFIDEIHTLVGAGSVSGSAMDASNILKPMLANGKLKCIGATTFSEFRNDFSKDKALSRRFAKIDVDEPSISNAILILEGLKSKYEEFHGVKYSKGAIKSAVELSKKYITDRFLPDCAIDVIDEVGASKKISASKSAKKQTLNINVKDVESTISKMAHIPEKSATKSDLGLLKSLEKSMQKRVFGQDNAISTIVLSIKRNKAGLGLDKKPIGSFLFTGPTGVGKTEVAKELSNQLGIHFERFDMSEYMEAHTISRLIGAPAGYVGFEQGGLLTEAIRKHPHCVLLLDEVEKAHPDLMSILLQVMDNAELTDNGGNKADFQNVILIMTSNLGATEANVMGFAKNDNLNESKAVNKFFAPEFRNRLDAMVGFDALTPSVVSKVAGKFIDDLEEQLSDKDIKIQITSKAKNELARLGYDKAMGARPLNRVISDKIKNVLTDEILFGKLKKGGLVKIDFKDEFIFTYEN